MDAIDMETLWHIYQSVFADENGHTVLEDLKERGRFHRTTFVQNDPCATAFNEGMRAMVLTIVNFLKLTPADLQTPDNPVEERF